MKFSVIIVNYNLSKEVVNCINSIIENVNDTELEIIVVDNNSEEPEAKNISENIFPHEKFKIDFFYLNENRGFGYGNNFGFKKTSGEIIVLLNPDTTIKTNVFLKVESIFKSEPNIYVLGPRIVNEKGVQEKSAGKFPGLFLETLNILFLSRIIEKLFFNIKIKLTRKDKIKTDWVTGSAMFIKRTEFEKINGFDTNFFMYSEEVDLCKRIKEKNGKIIYCPVIEVVHKGSTSSRKNYYSFTITSYESKVYYIKKHFNGLRKLLMLLILVLHIVVQMIVWSAIFLINPNKASGKLKAFPRIISKIFT